MYTVHFFRKIFNSAKKVSKNKKKNKFKFKFIHTEEPLIKHPQGKKIKNNNLDFF